MAFINLNLLKPKYIFIGLLIAICWIVCCQLALANIADTFSATNSLVISEISLSQKIEEPLDLEKWNLEYWQDNPEFALNKKQLLALSKRLRDVARYLGAKWSVSIPLTEQLRITDLTGEDGKWVSLTAGQALGLVTQELKVLDTSGEQPVIQFLVKDNTKNVYHPLSNVPLSRYCYELLENVKH